MPTRPEDVPYAVGSFLGQGLVVVLLAVAATLAARTLIGRRRGGGWKPARARRSREQRRADQLADEVG